MNKSSTYSISEINTVTLPRQRAKRHLQSIDVFILLVGAFSSIYINVVGQLYISEIILICLFPFFWIRKWTVLLKDRLSGRILLFGGLWLISQIFTDLIRNTPTNDMLRGWAGILVLLITFSSIYLLTKKNVQRIQFFVLGYAIGACVGLYLQPPAYFLDEPWKFGLGYPITLLVLLFISYTSREKLASLNKWVFPLIALGGLSFYFGSRSLGAAILLTAMILCLRNHSFGKAILIHLSSRNILAGGLILGLAIWGLSSVYSFAAQNGYLGQKEQWRYAQQGSGRFGLLLGGRSEILASAIAIVDSPIIGHGSWAKDPAYRVFIYRLIDLGYERSQEELSRYVNQSDLIPAHSHLFQAWVWAGILGALFWIVILRIIIRAFIQSNHLPNSLYILVIFVCIASVWDIFFSPFGSIMRIRWAIEFVIFLTAIYQADYLRIGMEKQQETGTM